MMKNASVKLGLFFGLAYCLAAYALALKVGFYAGSYYMYKLLMMYGFILVGVPITVFIEKRNNGGQIDFKEVLKKGMFFSLVLAVILAVFNYVYHTFIAIDAIDYFVSEAKKEALLKAKNAADIPKFLDAVRDTFSSFRIIPPALFGGLIVSVLSGAIFGKK